MITPHLLPEAAFSELAQGAGRPATMRLLGEAQLSKHLMLLHAIAQTVCRRPVPGWSPVRAALRRSWPGYRPPRPKPPTGCSAYLTWAGGCTTS